MQTYKIAVVAGDGIGPEVVASGIAIMDAAVGVAGEFAIEYVAAPAGAATYLECGEDLPASSLAVCRSADAILLGACGLPDLRLGTAPDLAGRGIANPVATILSCAMLLDHLGRTKHDDTPAGRPPDRVGRGAHPRGRPVSDRRHRRTGLDQGGHRRGPGSSRRAMMAGHRVGPADLRPRANSPEATQLKPIRPRLTLLPVPRRDPHPRRIPPPGCGLSHAPRGARRTSIPPGTGR